jgi:hypothetical protein
MHQNWCRIEWNGNNEIHHEMSTEIRQPNLTFHRNSKIVERNDSGHATTKHRGGFTCFLFGEFSIATSQKRDSQDFCLTESI